MGAHGTFVGCVICCANEWHLRQAQQLLGPLPLPPFIAVAVAVAATAAATSDVAAIAVWLAIAATAC